MPTPLPRSTTVPASPPSTPRLMLAPARVGRAVLDGGWWPRSWDPVAELPGLILALCERYGPIRQVMLNSDTWDARFGRLAVGTLVVRMGWYASLDPALAIATTAHRDQVDLLVVPPDTPEAAAWAAMTRAADPAETAGAPDILAALSATPAPTLNEDSEPMAMWDNEGGWPVDALAAQRPINNQPVAVSG
jgi:hypothetical protein